MNIRENLKAYIDGELSNEEMRQIDQAVEGDPVLKKELEELRAISQTIQSMGVQPQVQGYESTRDRLAPKRVPTGFLWKALGTAAVLSVLAAFLFPVFAANQEPELYAEVASTSAPAASMADAMTSESAPEEAGNARKSMSDEVVYSNRAADLEAPAVQHVIKTGDLELEVDYLDPTGTRIDIENIVADFGGYIEASNDRIDPDGQRNSQMHLTVRVESSSFETAYAELEKLGKRLNGSTDQQDVSAQIVDLEARLKALRAEEEQYVDLIDQAKNVNEVLDVREQLTEVRQEIEVMDATRKNLATRADLSTIDLTLIKKAEPLPAPKPDPNAWYDESVTGATDLVTTIGKFTASSLVYLVILTPIWLPVVAIALWRTKQVAD